MISVIFKDLVENGHLKNDLITNSLTHYEFRDDIPFGMLTPDEMFLSDYELILIDFNLMRKHSTVEWFLILNKLKDYVKTAIINTPEEKYILNQLISMGVRGAFYVNEHPSIVSQGVEAILQGDYWFPRSILSKYIEIFKSKKKESYPLEREALILTPREEDILREIAAGRTNEQIAENLYISPNTVRNHLASIYKKLEVKNRLQAALWAAKFL